MNNFTIRVYFHDPNVPLEKYMELIEIMKRNGIHNTITSDKGIIYALPIGEFNYSGSIDRNAMLEKVKAAAGEMAEKYAVLITESKGRNWYNLKEDTGNL
jgi:hypothetical protein